MAAPNFSNRTLYHSDNLPILRGMNSETIDLIATDPPFNKGRDFHATPDSLARGARFQDRWSWADDVEGEWVDRITDDWPAVHAVIEAARTTWGDDMAAFLCFMGVRLIEMRRILKPTGSLYLHCDPTASHYLKALLDGVFGKQNFRNEIVWCYAGGGVPRRDFPRKHDSILRYSKSKSYIYNPIYRAYSEGTQQRGRTKVKGKYFRAGLNPKGTPVNDWWPDVKKITSPTDPEKTGWPTQKSLELYERIIKASSNEGDMVLDPFCGCATTPVASERLGRGWVGIDIWDEAHKTVIERLQRETLASMAWTESVNYQTEAPVRTDDGQEAVPFVQVTERPLDTIDQMARMATGSVGKRLRYSDLIA